MPKALFVVTDKESFLNLKKAYEGSLPIEFSEFPTEKKKQIKEFEKASFCYFYVREDSRPVINKYSQFILKGGRLGQKKDDKIIFLPEGDQGFAEVCEKALSDYLKNRWGVEISFLNTETIANA